jgi:hypothetical protein
VCPAISSLALFWSRSEEISNTLSRQMRGVYDFGSRRTLFSGFGPLSTV